MVSSGLGKRRMRLPRPKPEREQRFIGIRECLRHLWGCTLNVPIRRPVGMEERESVVVIPLDHE